jgi:hypothetical protein
MLIGIKCALNYYSLEYAHILTTSKSYIGLQDVFSGTRVTISTESAFMTSNLDCGNSTVLIQTWRISATQIF